MQLDELNGKYQHLLLELDAAYAAPVWDSQRIDRIAAELIPVELALASLVHGHAEGDGAGDRKSSQGERRGGREADSQRSDSRNKYGGE